MNYYKLCYKTDKGDILPVLVDGVVHTITIPSLLNSTKEWREKLSKHLHVELFWEPIK